MGSVPHVLGGPARSCPWARPDEDSLPPVARAPITAPCRTRTYRRPQTDRYRRHYRMHTDRRPQTVRYRIFKLGTGTENKRPQKSTDIYYIRALMLPLPEAACSPSWHVLVGSDSSALSSSILSTMLLSLCRSSCCYLTH